MKKMMMSQVGTNLHVSLMYKYSIHELEYLALDVIILLIC